MNLSRALRIALAVSAIVLACAQPAGAATPHEMALQKAKDVQGRHTTDLLAVEGICGTAARAGEVLVLAETSSARGRVPKVLEGLPVTTVVTGKIMALPGAADASGWFPRPVPIGVSTGNEWEASAGTISARVIGGGNVYALSCNHVYALENSAPLGSLILQPGLYDTGGVFVSDDVIGALAGFQPILFRRGSTNTIDAAVALSSADLLGNSTPPDGYGTPFSGILSAAVGQNVQKYGRTTALTHGAVTGVNATIKVGYSSGTATFVGQIIVQSADAFVLPGDSGSLLVTDPGARPVGLIFAANQSGTYAFANRIDLVLSRFNVTIDGAPLTDLAVTSVNAPSSVVRGAVVNVAVGVANVGTQAIASDIGVTLKDQTGLVTIGSKVIVGGLAAGASTTLTFPWNTAGASLGGHTLAAAQGFSDGAPDNDSMTAVVTVKSLPVTVTSISPNSIKTGATISVRITGSAFAPGATVAFQNGIGAAPVASNVVVANSTTITASVAVKGSASRPRAWDVRVTNRDGTTGILRSGFTVTP